MSVYSTPWKFFLYANFSIKLIFIALSIASLFTWFFIIQRLFFLRAVKKAHAKFEKEFWSDIKLTELYETLPDALPSEHLHAIFYAGFTEFCRLRDSGCQTLRVLLEGVSRAMHIAHAQSEIHIESHLHWLTVITSGSPYLGLMGTLLGIVSSLKSLGQTVQPNALLLVAPGIAESLIISILGLLITLPALIFHHYYQYETDKLLKQYHIFEEEFVELLLRQAYEEPHENLSSQ